MLLQLCWLHLSPFPQPGDIESLKDCPLQVLNLSGDGRFMKFTGELSCMMAQDLTHDVLAALFVTHPSPSPQLGDIESLKNCPLQVLNLSGGGFSTKFTGELSCMMAQSLTAPLAHT